MNMKELKEKMQRDIEKLPFLDIEIMAGKVLYKEAFKLAFKAYVFLFFTACIIFIPDFSLFGKAFLPNFFKYLVVWALFFPALIALGFNSLTTYLILKHTIFPKLETGEFLRQKMLWIRNLWVSSITVLIVAYTFWLSYASIHHITYLHNEFDGFIWSAYLLLVIVPTMFFVNIVTGIEFNRLGISVFYNLVRALVTKEDPNAPLSSGQQKSGVPPEVDMGNAANPLSELNPHYHHWNPWDHK